MASISALRGLPGPSIELPDPAVAFEAGVAEGRRRLARQIHLMLGGHREAPTHRRRRDDDPGLFGPDSVTWRVHGDISTLIGGLRALLLQTMHPLAMAGVADHSDFRHDPLGRLWRTGVYVSTTTYGSTADAEAAVAMVKRVHRRVTGTAPDGRPYAANDPHLLTWVHHAEVDSFLRTYQRYGGAPLSADDADRYVDEMAVLCELFEAEPAARSVAELRAYFHSMKSELRAGRQARETAAWLMAPPLAWPARIGYGVIAPAAVGLLPRSVRRALWLPMPPGVDPVLVQPAARGLLGALGWVMAPTDDDPAPDASPAERPAPTLTAVPETPAA